MPNPRRANTKYHEQVVLIFDHAAVADADRTDKFFKVPVGKTLRVDAVDYLNVTGLVAHAANWCEILVQKGATSMFGWITDADGLGNINGAAPEGTIAADTFVAMTAKTAAADRVCAAGDVLSIKFNEEGTTTLPAGRVVVRGTYV